MRRARDSIRWWPSIFDDKACETLRCNQRKRVANVGDWEILEDDVSDLDFSEYVGIDLLSGGPPWQSFS